ncbi:MAG: ATP-binding protein [Balneolia bacterium]|nr:ATP-binding protein [Balneolia bacterium]
MEITKTLQFSEQETTELEMHSFINLVTVVQLQLVMLRDTCAGSELEELITLTEEFHKAIQSKQLSYLNDDFVDNFQSRILDFVEAHYDQIGEEEADFHIDNFTNVFSVMVQRMGELKKRWDTPEKWEKIRIDEFKADFLSFFSAMEKNSKGRYRIIRNIAEQEERDYLVNFEIDSCHVDYIIMPLLLKDVVRDLVANARKYTAPGGTITLGISQQPDELRIVVVDTGYGISSEEIDNVVDYGYRASNVSEKVKTMGGGFGLTKAYHITRRLGGRLWIDSEVNEGTKITIRIPVAISN